MTQYDERVQYQRDLLAAEEWSKTVKSVHAHSLSSMWYDTRPQDTKVKIKNISNTCSRDTTSIPQDTSLTK